MPIKSKRAKGEKDRTKTHMKRTTQEEATARRHEDENGIDKTPQLRQKEAHQSGQGRIRKEDHLRRQETERT